MNFDLKFWFQGLPRKLYNIRDKKREYNNVITIKGRINVHM